MARTLPHKVFETSILVLILASLLGCSAPPTTAPEPTAAATLTPAALLCEPSPIQASDSGLSEIQGTMHSDGELWALLFFGKAHVNGELKIVWRITGAGEDFTVEARLPDGTVIEPAWGPQYHESSTWERPGEEWGTSFIFPKPGCWTLTATSGTTIGEIRIKVLAP